MSSRNSEDTNYLLKMPDESEAAMSGLYWNRLIRSDNCKMWVGRNQKYVDF